MKEDYEMNKEFGVRPALSLSPAFFPSRPSSPTTSDSSIISRDMAFNLAAYMEPTIFPQHSSIDFPKDGSINEEDLVWVCSDDWDYYDLTTSWTKQLPLSMSTTPAFCNDRLVRISSVNPCDEQHETSLEERTLTIFEGSFELVDNDDDDAYQTDGGHTKSEAAWRHPLVDSQNPQVQREHTLMVGHGWTLPKKNQVAESRRTALSRSLLLLVSLVRNAVLT